MKRGVKKKSGASAIAVALTWDGARASLRSLPAKAKKFLGTKTAPSAKKMAQLFTDGSMEEIRICWVPSLRGGDDVLSAPFPTADGKRIPYSVTKTQLFGDMLGVIYRRAR